jgi:glycosyltransferase involved in cell wall biosynthesis
LVVLTWNEEQNIVGCLESLVRQGCRDLEVIVVDAGSTDLTAGLVRQAQAWLPFPIRLHVGPPGMPIGAARNLGVSLARASKVAFLSADARVRPTWVAEALHTLSSADMAFGPQVHSPSSWTVGAAVRGLRYAFPEGPTTRPLSFASNVAAAYHKSVLQRFPFDPWANAAEDLLLARRADAVGYKAVYNPAMVANHRDVASLRQELRKNVREGRGWGLYARELGVRWLLLAWSAVLLMALVECFFSPGLGLGTLAATLWLPALRRGARRRNAMPFRSLLAGIALSPAFDLVFLAQYLRGLARMRRAPTQPLPEILQ